MPFCPALKKGTAIDEHGGQKENQTMIKKFKDLVTSVDVLNTVHGGVSEPFLSITEGKGGREVRVRIPGVDKEAMQVEINNNKLSIFYLIPILSAGKMIHMPQIVYDHSIPYFVDTNKIKASYDDNTLVVLLPFNKRSNGYNRKIEIGEE